MDYVGYESMTSVLLFDVINYHFLYHKLALQMVPYYPFLLLKSGELCKFPCYRSNGDLEKVS